MYYGCSWILIIFGLFPCNAQEHLTCLRTDDVINVTPPTTVTTVQGRPGRRGPQGPKGDSIKGMKGEPGISDHSVIESLRDNITRVFQRGFMELEDGWITPFNGYQYKTTPNLGCCRSVCQSWGGDLIVHGIRDHAARATIKRALRLNNDYWIGLNDKETEGNMMWLNGNRASVDDVTLWWPGQPNNNAGNANCVLMRFTNNAAGQFLANDQPCSELYKSICEKLI